MAQPFDNLSASVSITGADQSVEALRAREAELQAQPAALEAAEVSPVETPPVMMPAPSPNRVLAQENSQWRSISAERQYQSLVSVVGQDAVSQRYEEWFSLLPPESQASTASFMRYHASAYGPTPTPSQEWDAEAANARAASRPVQPFADSTSYSSGATLTAAPNAGAAFDREAYERARTTDYYVNNAAPEAPADAYADLGHGRADGVDADFAARSSRVDAKRTTPAAVANRPRYASYEEFSQAKSDVLSDARNQYAASGRGADIGGAGFSREVSEANVSLGLEAAPEVRAKGLRGLAQNMREDFAEPFGALNYGFAISQLGQEGGQYYAHVNNGSYVTPEENTSAAAGLLGGVGAIAGTAIGSMLAPGVGSWVGGMIGGGAGSAAAGLIGANEQREQSIRQTSEMVGTLTGSDASAVREFTEALRGGTAAVKEVGQAFTTLTNAGPGVNTTASLAGAQFMSNALGERFNPALSGIEQAIGNDPILRGLQPMLGATGGKLTPQQYGDLAVTEAFSGDFAASNNALTLQQGSLSTQYDRDKHFVDEFSQANPFIQAAYPTKVRAMNEARARMEHEAPDAAAGATLAQTVQERDAAFGLYVGSASSQETARAGIGLAETRLSLVQASGGGSADMAAQQASIRAMVTSSTPALQAEAVGIGQYLSAHPDMNPQMRLALQRTQDDDLAAPEKLALLAKQTDRAVFDEQRREREGEYSLTQSGFQSTLTRGRLSGQTNAELQGSEDASLAAQRGYADQQRTDAANTMVTPAQRSAMLASANALDTNALTEVYNFREAGYAQNLGRIGLQSDHAALSVTNAQIGGGPQENYQAAGQVVAAFQAKIGELTNELQRGGLTVEDRTAKEREMTGARAAAERAEDSRNQAYFSDQSQLTGTARAIAGVGQERAIRRGGNAAFDPNILALDQQAITDAQGHLDFDLAHTPGNRQRIDTDRLALARAKDAPNADLDVLNTYTRDGATSRRMMNDRTQAQIADLAPWMNGPQSNPLTAHNAEISDLRGDLTALDANRGRAIAAGRWRDEDETTYTGQRNQDRVQLAQFEHQRVYSGLLPQEVEKLIGGERGGIGFAIQPLAAQSAASGASYNPLFGGFGQHASGYLGMGNQSREGGAPGSWFMGAGGGHLPGAGGSSSEVVAAIHALIGVIRDGQRENKNTSLYAPPNPQAGPAGYTLKNGGLK